MSPLALFDKNFNLLIITTKIDLKCLIVFFIRILIGAVEENVFFFAKDCFENSSYIVL